MTVNAGTSLPAPASPGVTVEHRVGREVVWRSGDVERLVYHYMTDQRKAFIHPLRTRGGAVLTDFTPADHPWHRGLWFAWKYLNGVNFWEEAVDGAAYGRTEFAGIDELVWRADQTTMTTRYDYRDPAGTGFLSERRTLQVGLPADGSCTIDWDTTFTAYAQPVHLDRTAITPETAWGGYAGLSFRGAAAWHDIQGLDSEGRRNLDLKNKRARWVQIAGVGEDGQCASVAMLDHPENPRYPTYWYYGDATDPLGFAFVNPSLVLAEPYVVRPGETMRLRYRILVHTQALTAAVLNEQHAAFAAGLPILSPDAQAPGPRV